MKHNYNYTRRKLYLPEYGRHIHEMVDQLMEIPDITFCPHGRPVAVKLTKYELEKMFKRA